MIYFNFLSHVYKTFRTKSVWWRVGFLRIFTVASLLSLAPAGGYKPNIKSYYENTKNRATPPNLLGHTFPI